MDNKVKIGCIGLGRRGTMLVRNQFSCMEDVEIVAICDLAEDRIERAAEIIAENSGNTPKMMTTDYREVINNPELDAVVIMTCWRGRAAMAVESMKAGKYTAIEVGCADTLEECWELVDTYEATGVPVMMLENCCYGRREMMVLKMVKEGLFGDVVHCTGGYHHYLNEIDFFHNIETENPPHYRLPHYIEENRENYPTHELGPISKVLNINRGNRFLKLMSLGSKALGIKEYAKEHLGQDSKYANIDYKQSDIVNTYITCAGGETIMITLDTTLPRAYYSRNFSVRGTRGMSSEERRAVYLSDMKEGVENNEAQMYEKYDHPLHAEYSKAGVKRGHGGIDWLVCRAFIESVKAKLPTPIDAYDTAAWMAVGVLSAQSIEQGNVFIDFPDFTRGKWENREPSVPCKYSLDLIVKDDSISVV